MKRFNSKLSDQSGSHVLAVALVVLALGVVGFAGYKVQQAHTATYTVTHTAAESTPASIKGTADLNQTSQALDDSSAQLDSSLDDAALDADLNSML
jgi:uncharacterized protein HemX